jgi:hypothetical protein
VRRKGKDTTFTYADETVEIKDYGSAQHPEPRAVDAGCLLESANPVVRADHATRGRCAHVIMV